MARLIKINEQQLKRLVMEAIGEMEYSTYKSAHDKMKAMGQHQRAQDFNDTFKDVHDDDNTAFDLDTDTVWLTNPEDGERHMPRTSAGYHRDGSITTWDNGAAGVKNISSPKRTTDRKLARHHAQMMDFYYGGNSPYTRNDFIAECVDKVFAKYLR